MTLKEMKEMARRAFEEKNGSKTTEYIETVGNKGVQHERPKGSTPKIKEEEEDYGR